MPVSLTIEPKPSNSTTKVIGFVFLLILQATTTFAECPDRPKALGMEDKRVPDSSIRASSAYNNNYRAAYGRLRSESGFGGWLAPTRDKNPWFQVNFGSIVTITQVATQGMSRFGARTMTYTLSHSGGSGSFVSYNNNQTFPANIDRNTIVAHILNPPIVTRVVRIMPKTWRWYPALRAEFYGCRPVPQGQLTRKAVSADSIQVAWQIVGNSADNSLPCGFNVTHRKATGSNKSWIVETLEATATQYTIRNLLAYTTYMIQVEALNGACSGTFNPAITVTTGEKAPSAPPQNVTIVPVTYFGVLLKWFPPPNEKRNGKLLQYSVTVESLSSGSATESQSIYGNFYHNNTSSEQQGLFDGLQSNTKYQIVITANNGAGSSPPSSPVPFKTLKPGPTVPSTTQQNTEDTQPSTQEPTSIPTVSKGKQKDAQSGANSNMVIGLVVAAVFVLAAVLLICFVLYRRRKKKGGESPKEVPEGSLYNNRIKAPQARHIPNKEEADFYMAPVDNHKRWEQLQQQTKTGPARSTYNSEEISMYKQNHLNYVSNFSDDFYSYAAPDGLSSTINREEIARSAQSVQHNPIYEAAENGEPENVKISNETLQHIQENHIYTAVTDQPSFSKETKPVFTKTPAPKRTKTNSPPTEIVVGGLPTVDNRSQIEPEYDVLEGPEPSSSLNNVSSSLYEEVYSTASRGKSEKEGASNYDVIWSSNNKPTADTRSKPKAQKTPTRKAVIDTPGLYDKLWMSRAGDELQHRNVQSNIYDNTYDTVGDIIH